MCVPETGGQRGDVLRMEEVVPEPGIDRVTGTALVARGEIQAQAV